jgi:hypothetical protein
MGDSRPLWQQVLEGFERRSGSGDIVGRFPTDEELSEHYGVSRHTFREAVRHLRARDLVDRGRGSFLSDGHERHGPRDRHAVPPSWSVPETIVGLVRATPWPRDLDRRPERCRNRCRAGRSEARRSPPTVGVAAGRSALGGRSAVLACSNHSRIAMAAVSQRRKVTTMSSSNAGAAAGGGAIYGLGILGAWVYFWQEAESFWQYLLAIVQGIFWPAFMVYEILSALG